MSISATNWAYSIPDLRGSERGVLLALAYHHNAKTSRCFPGLRRLSRMTGLSRRHILRVLNQLEAKTLLKREARKIADTEGRTSNEYRLPILAMPQGKWKSIGLDIKSAGGDKKSQGYDTVANPSAGVPPKHGSESLGNTEGTKGEEGVSFHKKPEKEKPATYEELIAIFEGGWDPNE